MNLPKPHLLFFASPLLNPTTSAYFQCLVYKNAPLLGSSHWFFLCLKHSPHYLYLCSEFPTSSFTQMPFPELDYIEYLIKMASITYS